MVGYSPQGRKESDTTERLHFHFLLLQTLPVGSVVLSVLATDKDTGSSGAVVYSIENVSVYGPRGSVGAAAPRGHQGAASPTQPAGTLQTRSSAMAQPWSPHRPLAPSGPIWSVA